jgi:hypothetical protein
MLRVRKQGMRYRKEETTEVPLQMLREVIKRPK